MPYTAADLLSPIGPLDSSLFPGEQSNVLTGRLNQYLANGYGDARVAAQTDVQRKDSLARAWALHQAFQDVYIRMSGAPLSVTVTEKGGHAYGAEQIKNMKALSDKYLGDFNGLLLVSPDAAPSQLPGTVSVRNIVEW